MRFAPTEEQALLRESARGWLAANPAPTWDAMVAEQGWQAIAIPESAGGFGFGMVELALVAEEVGRTLAPLPLVATCGLAAPVLGGAWLEAIAAGSVATVAVGAAVTATRTTGGWRLTGTANRVIAAADAAFVVVPSPAGAFVVPADQLAVTAVPTLDLSRPLARIAVDTEVPDEARLDRPVALERAWVLLAAEAVGAAERMLDESVAYAKIRKQFGRPIGSFQAIQHACADLLLLVESARAATWAAAWAADHDPADLPVAARAARAYAADALFRCAADSVQIHGGIGFTWEHPAHRYLKRAAGDRNLLGAPSEHREAVAASLLGPV